MLAYILALAVGLGSIALYLGAFLTPELHRKNDFIWSGVGLFYALVLWVCAQRITGGVLLGQIAGVALLGWFAWQVVLLRRALLPAERQAAVLNLEALQQNLGQLTTGDAPQTLGRLVGSVAERVQALISTTTVQKPAVPKVAKPKVAPPQPMPSRPLEEDVTVDGEPLAEPVVDASTTAASVMPAVDETTEEGTDAAATDASQPIEVSGESGGSEPVVTPAVSPLSQATDLVGTVQKQAKEIWGMFFKPKKSRPMIELRRPASVEAEPDEDGLLEDDDLLESATEESEAIESAVVEDGTELAVASADSTPPADPDADDWFEDNVTASVETVEPSTTESPVVDPLIASAELAESAGEADDAEAVSGAIADDANPVSDSEIDQPVAADPIAEGDTNQESTDGSTDVTTEPQPDSREA